jgi:hypothetical protein
MTDKRTPHDDESLALALCHGIHVLRRQTWRACTQAANMPFMCSGGKHDIQDDFRAVATGAAEGQLNVPRVLHVPSDDFLAEEQTPRGGHWPKGATYISRDAVSHLMNLRGLSSVPNDPLLIDVRRCAFFRRRCKRFSVQIVSSKCLNKMWKLHACSTDLICKLDSLCRVASCSFRYFRSVHPSKLVKVLGFVQRSRVCPASCPI